MKLALDQLVVLTLLGAPTHWLIARSQAMRWLWSRAGWWDGLFKCAACSGFWIGLAASAHGLTPVTWGWPVLDQVTTAVLSMLFTPVVEGVMLWGLYASAMDDKHEGSV